VKIEDQKAFSFTESFSPRASGLPVLKKRKTVRIFGHSANKNQWCYHHIMFDYSVFRDIALYLHQERENIIAM
jgi:hypothetical protein